MKKVGIIKRIATVGLIFLLGINSFAATMGDNDGSAFITKAEFDSLKNNFQSQIDTYNQSIDIKIDAAIASYLQGIDLKKESKLIDLSKNYRIDGNLDDGAAGLVWSSAIDKYWCADQSQLLAFDYTLVAGMGTNGAYWHGILNSGDRVKTRYIYDENGFISGRKICYFYLMGSASYRHRNNSGSFSDVSGIFFLNSLASNINKRTTDIYLKINGNKATATDEPWFVSEAFLYNEIYQDTTEKVAVYPLAEVNDESVVDMGVSDPSFTTGTYRSLGAAFGFNRSNGIRLGTFNLITGNVTVNDYVDMKIDNIFKKIKPADFKFLNFYNINSGNDKIKCGVVVTEVNDNGEITVKGTVNKDGYIIFYSSPTANELWDGQRNSITDTTSWKAASKGNAVSLGNFTRTIKNVKKGDKLYMLYLPTDTTAYGEITLSEIMLQIEE